MHPVQAAPRQSTGKITQDNIQSDAPRAGSAEAKLYGRDRRCVVCDAPRAGSAEAKSQEMQSLGLIGRMHPVRAAPRQSAFASPVNIPCYGCTPCRQRRGKAQGAGGCGGRPSMHPVQAAPRQSKQKEVKRLAAWDAPRAGSAEAKSRSSVIVPTAVGCTPCRQRRGKEEAERRTCNARVMHPVQAAHSEITTCRPMVL